MPPTNEPALSTYQSHGVEPSFPRSIRNSLNMRRAGPAVREWLDPVCTRHPIFQPNPGNPRIAHRGRATPVQARMSEIRCPEQAGIDPIEHEIGHVPHTRAGARRVAAFFANYVARSRRECSNYTVIMGQSDYENTDQLFRDYVYAAAMRSCKSERSTSAQHGLNLEN